MLFPRTRSKTPSSPTSRNWLIRRSVCSDLWVGQRPRRWHCPRAARTGPACGLQRALLMEAVRAPPAQTFLRVVGSTRTQQTPGPSEFSA